MTSDLKTIAVLSSTAAGGAGGAAHRFAEALNIDPELNADFIDLKRIGERLPVTTAPDESFSNFSISDTHYTVEHPGFVRGWLIEMLSRYDLINVHWANTLISLSELEVLSRIGRPLLLTLHDFNYFTGGCHYPSGCAGYADSCFACPQIDARRVSLGVPPETLRLKRAILSRPNVHVAAPSAYLVDRALTSGAIDPARAHCLRNAYLPVRSPKLELVGSQTRIVLIADSLTERRKNVATAIDALQALAAMKTEATFAIDVVGASIEGFEQRLASVGLPVERHGHLTSHKAIADVFARADLLLTCSLDDNWPNILVEGGAYGCAPVVGPGHGCAEFIKTYGLGVVSNGYLPENFADALVRAARLTTSEVRRRAVAEIRDDHRPSQVAQRLRAIWTTMTEARVAA